MLLGADDPLSSVAAKRTGASAPVLILEVQPQAQMRLSRYVRIFPWEEKPGHLLLFSTKTASILLVNEATIEAIEKGMLSSSSEALLSKHGVMVESLEEEKRSMLGFLDRLNHRNSGLNLMLVLNLDCNFACRYCYEEGIRAKSYMSEETAGQLLAFVEERFVKPKESLLIDYYGGEPLLSLGTIRSVSRALKRLVEKRSGSFAFTLVTNGALFTRKAAEELLPLGLESVKITLDGPAEIHNQSRPFKSGLGSFDTIVKNIQETCELVRINLGGNFDKNNYDRFPLLLDSLIEHGLTPDKLPLVKFDPIISRPKQEVAVADYKEGCMSVNEPWLLKAELFLREEILKRGFNTFKPKPMSCMIEVADSYVVNFDGAIYKCPAFIGKSSFETGHVRSGLSDCSAAYGLGIWKEQPCCECEYLPLCFGGCRYMAFLREGKADTMDCRKDYLEASLETQIKQNLKYATRVEPAS